MRTRRRRRPEGQDQRSPTGDSVKINGRQRSRTFEGVVETRSTRHSGKIHGPGAAFFGQLDAGRARILAGRNEFDAQLAPAF